MKIQNIIMSFAISSALTIAVSSCQQAQRENPLLQESALPYGAPDFSKIKTADYLPAFESAIKQTRDNIAKIVDNPDSATFENTIIAYEESGRLLDRVSRVFFALTEADKTPELGESHSSSASARCTTMNMTLYKVRIRNSWRRPTKSLCAKERCCPMIRKSA